MFVLKSPRLSACSFCRVFCAAVLICLPLSAQPIISSQTVWGAASDGLRMAISAVKPSPTAQHDAQFDVAIQNVGSTDTILNLGFMLANGKEQAPEAIQITISDSSRKERGLRWSSRAGVAGRLDDFIVALPAGATYVVNLNLGRAALEPLPAGHYRIAARFRGQGAQNLNLDTRGVALMNFWIGTIQALPLDFEIAN
jgi:hypothetical protein